MARKTDRLAGEAGEIVVKLQDDWSIVVSSGEIDVSLFGYDEWVEHVFAQPVVEERERAFDAYSYRYEPCDINRLVAYLTRLCREFATLLPRFSWPQINQGVWGCIGYCDPAFTHLMWGEGVEQAVRLDCVREMYTVYRDVVQHVDNDVVLEGCFFMWWDLICEQFCHAYNQWDRGVFQPVSVKGREVHDVLLETLVRVLALGDGRCEEAALHGLGHLHHPRCAEIVQRYIDENVESCTEEGLVWVEACRDGTVM